MLARPLPNLTHFGGMQEPSIDRDRLDYKHMRLWTGFDQEVRSALHSLNLTSRVSLTDPREGEQYVVGSELGLTGHFVQNLCVPVVKALTTITSMQTLEFGDIQAFRSGFAIIPDVSLGLVVTQAPNVNTLLAVGELKTYWTVELQRVQVDQYEHQVSIEPHIGMYLSLFSHFIPEMLPSTLLTLSQANLSRTCGRTNYALASYPLTSGQSS